jgi:hypothetical protein
MFRRGEDRPARGSGRRGDRGSQFIEYAAYLPLFLLVVVVVTEAFLSFLALERLETAARAGARVAAESTADLGRQTAFDALPPWLDHAEVEIGRTGTGLYAQVEVRTPILYPASPLHITLVRRVEMPDV